MCHVCYQIMSETMKDLSIKKCCLVPNRLSDLQNLSEGLERCQKSLNDYLDSKRNAFPRFFFISDDELLSILGSSEPTCVQEHMIKVGGQRLGVEFSGTSSHCCSFVWDKYERAPKIFAKNVAMACVSPLE